MIKPKTNSFVFEPASDPAIMLYLDPSRTRAQLENTVAHELHDIGYAAACHSARRRRRLPGFHRPAVARRIR